VTKPQYIQGDDGKLAGSIGAGKNSIPSSSTIPTMQTATATVPPVNYADIHSSFATLTRDAKWVLRQTYTKQMEIVTDDDTPDTLLRSLAKDTDTEPEILIHIARKTNDPETLQELSKKPYTAIRCWAIWNTNLPETELPRLSKDRDVNVRQGVMEHPKAQSMLCLQMGSKAIEHDRYVRQSARDHKNYPKKAERLALVNARDTSDEVLYALAGDGLPQVAKIARERLAAKGVTVPDFNDEEDE